jgi:precorrin-6A/cobalt-precorrin-6A reductase
MTAAHVLVLGGTGEGRALAARLAAVAGVQVTSSLAGRVTDPLLPPGEVRVGGFGGAQGLSCWLREHGVHALIDATHPFASRISDHAATAARSAGVPAIILQRPGWQEQQGDRWHRVPDLDAAAQGVPAMGRRAFLTIGRQEVAAFAGVSDVWFLIRSIEPPEPPLPAAHELLLARGPFTLGAERTLLREQGVDVLVTKDSGGQATSAKLEAARELGLPVLVVDRPALPAGVPVVRSVPEALDWLEGTMSGGRPGHSG